MNDKLYWAGVILVSAGIGCLVEWGRKIGERDAGLIKGESVWTEADKEVVGESSDADSR